jgi:hypothetical protein
MENIMPPTPVQFAKTLSMVSASDTDMTPKAGDKCKLKLNVSIESIKVSKKTLKNMKRENSEPELLSNQKLTTITQGRLGEI